MFDEIVNVKYIISPVCLVIGKPRCGEKSKCFYDINLDKMEFDSEEELKSALDKVNIKRIAGDFDSIQKVSYVWGEISTLNHDGKLYTNENWRNYNIEVSK